MKNYNELLTSIQEKANKKLIERKRRRKTIITTSVMACFLFVFIATMISTLYDRKPSEDSTSHNYQFTSRVDTEYKNVSKFAGLPVQNYYVDENLIGVEDDSIGFYSIYDWFSYYNLIDAIVVVRVNECNINEEDADLRLNYQISSLEVLSEVWKRDRKSVV